jgi:asparagine N-glycosylation enzyme membrane subunit Stt3
MTMNCTRNNRRTGMWIAIAVAIAAASMSASKSEAAPSSAPTMPLPSHAVVVMTLA